LVRRAHSEALGRSLAAARARSSRAQAPQAKVLSELIRLRRDFLTADRSVKQLQHETKMMRSAFQVRGAAQRAPKGQPKVAPELTTAAHFAHLQSAARRACRSSARSATRC